MAAGVVVSHGVLIRPNWLLYSLADLSPRRVELTAAPPAPAAPAVSPAELAQLGVVAGLEPLAVTAARIRAVRAASGVLMGAARAAGWSSVLIPAAARVSPSTVAARARAAVAVRTDAG